MKLIPFFLFLLISLLNSATFASDTLPKDKRSLAINLSDVSSWSSSFPFINHFKMAGGWFTTCSDASRCLGLPEGASAFDTKEQASLQLDENGYPKELPRINQGSQKFGYLTAILFQGNGGAHVGGDYLVLYDGEGDLSYAGSARKNPVLSKPGRDIVRMPEGPGTMLLFLKATNKQNHLRNIRILSPGGECSLPPRYVKSANECTNGTFRSMETLEKQGEVFHPKFLADLANFRGIRYMAWMGANVSKLARWEQRPKIADAFWNSSSGIPLEIIFALSKKLDVESWLNVPTTADDSYVEEVFRLASRALPSNRRVYIELGNEPWNYAPPFGVDGVNHENRGRQLPGSVGKTSLELRLQGYALRSVQVCRLAKANRGVLRDLFCTLNSQAVNPWVHEQLLSCPLAAKTLGRPCSQEIEALAIAPYFGHDVFSDATIKQINAWQKLPDFGTSLIFSEIAESELSRHDGMTPLYAAKLKVKNKPELERARSDIIAAKAIADKYKVKLVAYEAGQHLTIPLHHYSTELNDLLVLLNRDKRMGAVYSKYFDIWREAGGEAMFLLVYVAPNSKWGNWGLKEAQFDDLAPKWVSSIKYSKDIACWWPQC